MDLNSPEIQKLLAAVTDRTEKGDITWEVLDYDPIGFMTEMGVEFDGSETEIFAQNITFLCHLKKGRTIWLEAYESLGFPTPGGFPAPGDGCSLRGLAYITIRILSSRGQILYRCGSIVQNRRHALLLCLLCDAVFISTQDTFSHMPQNDPGRFLAYLSQFDDSGSLVCHPLTRLMTDFYRYNRCMDFHFLAMTCTNGLKKKKG